MFIRLSHRIKRAAVKNWRMKLLLAVIAFFAILTILACSMPAVTTIIFDVIFGFGPFFACAGFLAVMFGFPNEGLACSFLAIICVIFAAVILKGGLGYNLCLLDLVTK